MFTDDWLCRRVAIEMSDVPGGRVKPFQAYRSIVRKAPHCGE